MKEKYGFDISHLKAYSGYFKDISKLKQSTSGGAATALSEAIIKAGGIVFGVIYSENFKSCEYYCAENYDQLEKFKGSKYIESAKKIFFDGEYKSVYEVVAEKLNSGKTVLFIGLECVIAALYRHAELNDVNIENLYTVSLICHGPTFSKVAEDYITALEKKYRSKVKDFSVRFKKYGVKPPYIHAVFENGRVFEIPFYESDYGYAFGNYTLPGCYKCNFKGENHKADVAIGDYWGLTSDMAEYNKYGASVLITRTEKGENMVSMLDMVEFNLSESNIEHAILTSTMYYKSMKKPSDWETFRENLYKKGLHYAVVQSRGKLNYLLKCNKIAIALKLRLKHLRK